MHLASTTMMAAPKMTTLLMTTVVDASIQEKARWPRIAAIVASTPTAARRGVKCGCCQSVRLQSCKREIVSGVARLRVSILRIVGTTAGRNPLHADVLSRAMWTCCSMERTVALDALINFKRQAIWIILREWKQRTHRSLGKDLQLLDEQTGLGMKGADHSPTETSKCRRTWTGHC